MRVLVVEDELLVRLDLAHMLREDGCIVDEASNGLDALRVMRRTVPDVVLLDLRIPVTDGYEFNAERMRDPTLASVPLVLVSANVHDAEALTLGAAATVDKPVAKPHCWRPSERWLLSRLFGGLLQWAGRRPLQSRSDAIARTQQETHPQGTRNSAGPGVLDANYGRP